MTRSATMFAMVSGLMLASNVAAQAEVGANAAAVRGDRSISLNVVGGTEIGYWIRISDRTDLGLNLGIGVSRFGDDDREDESLAVSLAPALKMYAAPRGPLAPYTYANVFVEYGRSTIESGEETRRSTQHVFGGSGGIGLDWFPIASVSIGGHIGATGGYISQSVEFEEEVVPDPQDADGFFVNSFSSGIRVHLYF